MYRDVRSKWVGEPEYRAWTFSFELLKRKNWLCPSPTSARLHLKLVILTNDFKFESFPSKSSMSVENYFCSWRERERSVLRSCGHVWIVQLTHTQALHSSGAQHSTVTATSPCFWFNFDCFSITSILLLLVCIMSPVLRRHGNCIEANLLLLCCMVLTPWGHSVLVGDHDQETNRK